ncbi:hypothetical protein TNCT_346831 [Trichonephila clavata]|uniref:Uncharacterized protein n=1 Tax=Trichonephila clavata TaxID=2740835 RepID=A0A8X6G6L0_TRICU|nr:hypothetical protein TNCT_346831 [Trichonephila clavata]
MEQLPSRPIVLIMMSSSRISRDAVAKTHNGATRHLPPQVRSIISEKEKKLLEGVLKGKKELTGVIYRGAVLIGESSLDRSVN